MTATQPWQLTNKMIKKNYASPAQVKYKKYRRTHKKMNKPPAVKKNEIFPHWGEMNVHCWCGFVEGGWK